MSIKVKMCLLLVCLLIGICYFLTSVQRVKLVRQPMTSSQYIEMFNKVGGVNEVNREAKMLFALYGTNETRLLETYSKLNVVDYPDLTNYLAICALGDTVWLDGGGNKQLPEIEVRFGDFRKPRLIRIFPPDIGLGVFRQSLNASNVLDKTEYYYIATNIYVER